MANWSMQEAKARFSDVVEGARAHGPQTITRHGKAVVVILSAEEYGRLKGRKKGDDLVSFFRTSPLVGVENDIFKRLG